MRLILCTALFSVLALTSCAPLCAATTGWIKTYKQTGINYWVTSVIQANDGGYAIVGSARNNSIIDKYAHFYLLKTDSSGNFQWDMKYGMDSGAYSVIQTSDEGYAMAGIAGFSLLLVKTDANGVIPEIPTLIALPLFMVSATLTVLVLKRRTAKSA